MEKIESASLFKISYGLYVVTCNDGMKDNGLIVNTVIQQASSPLTISVTINKANYSHDVIKSTGKMNVNCLNINTPFDIFENFGWLSVVYNLTVIHNNNSVCLFGFFHIMGY